MLHHLYFHSFASGFDIINQPIKSQISHYIVMTNIIIPATTNSMTAKIKPPGPDIHKTVNIIKIINF
ncbi:hypothetical protein [Klebsiella phage vB_KshKPC-M]|nr:hypothetical protein [Klebsiella phage vB_KshKPC-M]